MRFVHSVVILMAPTHMTGAGAVAQHVARVSLTVSSSSPEVTVSVVVGVLTHLAWVSCGRGTVTTHVT